jgi:hypothetical protein
VSPSSPVLKPSDAPAEGAKTAKEAAAAIAPRPLDHAGAQDGDSPPRIEAAAAIAPRPLEPRLQDVDDLVNDCPTPAAQLLSKKEGQTVYPTRTGLTVPGSCSSHARDVEESDTDECDEYRPNIISEIISNSISISTCPSISNDLSTPPPMIPFQISLDGKHSSPDESIRSSS